MSLIADNGIIQNAGATITTDLVNSTKLVNVSMTAKGNFQGTDAANANSKGITLNSTITTNGNVTLDGTNQNTGGGRNNSGVVFNGGSGITAKEIYVKGIQKRPGTTDANGIAFNGSATFNSTGASIFEGVSSSIGNASAGVYVEDGATLNLNSGAGSIHFKGDNTNAGYRGIRLGFVSPATTNVNINGNVIFGTDANAKQTFLRANLNVNSGSVTLQGSEVQFYDGAVLTAKNATTVNLTGKTINLGQAGSSVIKKDTGGFSLNMTGDKVMIQNTASVDAGTGTVAVKTLTSGMGIQLGADDVASKMGLTNAELGLIKAGQVVIGDTSSNGAITVAGATSTNATTGNITLQTGGNIDVNAALTIAASKTLTLNGAGASSSISQANTNAGITADKVEFLGNTATVSLQPASSINKIGMIAGKVKSFALTNQRDLVVGTVNSTVGLTATDDINLSTTTLTGTALTIANKIESTAGNVSLSAFTSDTASVPNAAVKSWAEVKGKDVTMNAVAQGASGYTLGYYGAGIGGKFTASGDLNLSGSSKNTGNGFYMYGGALSAGNALTISGTSSAGQGVGFDVVGASSVSIISNNGVAITGTASTAGKDAIGLNGVTLNNAAGAIKLDARAGNINTSSVTNTLTQNGNGDVTLTTVGNGNITVPKIINNGTGNVIIAAGSDLLAGNGNGGQVKTIVGNTVTNTNSGKFYVYSGSATQTGTLSNLDDVNLADLYLDSSSSDGAGGFIKQNAESNVAYGATIASGAAAQVMFREKVSVNLQDELNGATFNSTYGDANTKNGQSAALWGDVQGAMKDANKTGGVINQLTSTMKDANNNDVKFHVSAATVIDSMTGNIPVADAHYSNADYLKANAANGNTGYVYSIPALNGKYTVAFVGGDAGKVKVDVAQKAVSYNGVSVDSKVYDGTTNAVVNGTAALLTGGINATDSKVMTNDKVALDGAVTGQYDTKNVRGTDGIGTNNVTLSGVTLVAGVGGDDSANYKFNDKQAVIDGNNTITVKTVTYSGVSVGTKVYDGNTNANLTGSAVLSTIAAGTGNANDSKVIAGDNVALDTTNFKGTYDTKNVRGTDGAGANNVTLSGAALVAAGSAGDDTTNYNFVQPVAQLNGDRTITPKGVTVSAAGNSVIFNSKQQIDSVSDGGGFVAGDQVGRVVGAGTGVQAGAYQSNLALVGTAAETIDQSNYAISFKNAALTISAQNYVRPPVETTILSPVTFGLAYTGGATAAGGDGVDIASACDAWSQRAGSGSIAVMSLLKPNTMGLRTAKTDTMDAMSGSSASASAVEAVDSPCSNGLTPNNQASL